MTTFNLSLTVTADGKLAVRELTQVTAAEKGVEDQQKRSTTTTRAAKDELERYMASLRKEAETVGMSRSQLRLYEAARLGATQADLRAIEVSNKIIEAQQRQSAGFSMLTRTVAGFVSIAAAINIAKHLAESSDNAILLSARIGQVTAGLYEQQKVQRELFQLAKEVQLPYQEIASQFPRIARAIQGYGGSTRDAINITKIFAETVRISGGTQQEATASALQFAQALQSGRLAGDELRSVLENNGVLANFLAKGLGVSVGELRKLGEEGKLTSDKVVGALLAQQSAIETQAKSLPKTIHGSWQALENEIDLTTGKSQGAAQTTSLLAGAFELLAEAIKHVREEGERYRSVPFIGPAIAMLQQHDTRAPEASWNAAEDARFGRQAGEFNQRDAQQADAVRQFKELTKDIHTASSINQKYDDTLRQLSESFGKLGGYAGATKDQVARFNEAVAGNERDRRTTLEANAKKGQATLESTVELIRRRAELEAAGENAYHQLQQDNIARALEIEEHYHSLSLTNERDYIDAKASLQAAAARNAIDQLQGELARQVGVLKALQDQKGIGSTDVTKHQADIDEQDKKVLGIRTQLELATRRLGDVERRRGQDIENYDRRLLEYGIQIQRESEDYARTLADELKEMQAQVDLIGASELATAKANEQRRIWNRYLTERVKLDRELKDLERNGKTEEANIKAQQITDLQNDTREAMARVGPIIEEQFRKEIGKRIGDAVADAIVDGGPDAAKRLRNSIEDEFKKPIKLAISQATQGLVQSVFKAFPMLNPASWGPEVGMYGAAGGVFGGIAANAAGAGPRGQQLAGTYGAAGATAGSLIGSYISAGSSAGPWGAAIGAVIGIIAAIASDPSGNANRTARVGPNPAGQYTYAARSPFGKWGVYDDKWFSDENMGDDITRFMAAQGQFETSLAGRMTPEERARATASLSTPHEYSFGTEHGRTLGLGDILKDRLQAIVEAAMPGLGKLIQAFQGTGEELTKFVESLFGMRESLGDLDKMIAQMSSDSITTFKEQLKELDLTVTKAKTKLSEALDSGDATAIYGAEQELAAAVMNRYQTEIAMVEQLRDAIAEAKEQAYQFQLAIAQKIIGVGGSRDVAGIAMGRAMDLRGGIGGTANIGGQITSLNRYVGAIDTWYQARRSAIEQQMQAEQEALRAIAAAQQAAAQARISQLQGELQLANQYKEVVDRTRAMIDDMRISSANPLAQQGRLQLAGDDVRTLMEQYRTTTGVGRTDIANQILQAIATYRSLGEETYQRSSGEWQAIYNEIMLDLTEVEKDAKTYAERSVELEQSILEVQRQAAAAQMSIASASTLANGQLDDLNKEALGYYTWAEAEGQRLYTLQEQQHQEQLDAITGGQDVELYIAARQREAVDELKEIRRLIALYLATAGNSVPSPGGNGPTDTSGNGGTGVVTTNPKSLNVTIELKGGAMSRDGLRQLATMLKREIANA